jgi:glucosamine 6-phosphate synthetase-like amidotransferase/phosphosugar isomerase protein
MCGLAGAILSRRERSEEDREEIWRAFGRLLVAIESRGTDAAGAAVIRGEGSVSLAKLPVAAHRFVLTHHYARLRGALDASAVVLLGHARQATKGTVFSSANNHPIFLPGQPDLHGPVLGIHNGTIHNDDALFLKYGYQRVGEVDSEVALHIAAEMSRWPGARLHLLRSSLAELRGPTAMAWVVLEEPGTVFLARLGHPLSFAHDVTRGVLYFASLADHLRAALGEGCVPSAFEDQRIYCFDTSRAAQELGETTVSVASLAAERAVPSFDDLRRIAARSEFVAQLQP